MDPRERLRLALATVGCSGCGQPYPPDGVRILAQREAIAFVRLECPACATRILALVTGAPTDDDQAPGTEWTAVDRPLEPAADGSGEFIGYAVERPPIDELDVEAMHEFLDGYRGDLRSLLRRQDGPEDR